MMLFIAAFAGYLFIKKFAEGALHPVEWIIGFAVIVILAGCPFWLFHNLRAVYQTAKTTESGKEMSHDNRNDA